jgi:hypothetical protein
MVSSSSRIASCDVGVVLLSAFDFVVSFLALFLLLASPPVAETESLRFLEGDLTPLVDGIVRMFVVVELQHETFFVRLYSRD